MLLDPAANRSRHLSNISTQYAQLNRIFGASINLSTMLRFEFQLLLRAETVSNLISGFPRDVDLICGLLGDYTAS
jgi:hypothetical protein